MEDVVGRGRAGTPWWSLQRSNLEVGKGRCSRLPRRESGRGRVQRQLESGADDGGGQSRAGRLDEVVATMTKGSVVGEKEKL